MATGSALVLMWAVTAFSADQLVIEKHIKLHKRPDKASSGNCYLESGDIVTVLSREGDNWLKVSGKTRCFKGKKVTGFIKHAMPVAKKADALSAPLQVAAVKPPVTTIAPPVHATQVDEITMVPVVPTCDAELAALNEIKNAQAGYLSKEIEKQKKALAEAANTAAEKDKSIATLRAQAADAMLKLAKEQASVENEFFRLLGERASSVKLRGFGPIKLVPLLNDYLVVISPDLAKNVDGFFSKIRKVVVVGKAGTYLICDRKYFVAAPLPELVGGAGITPPSLGGAR